VHITFTETLPPGDVLEPVVDSRFEAPSASRVVEEIISLAVGELAGVGFAVTTTLA
jgi:hypothetical protein